MTMLIATLLLASPALAQDDDLELDWDSIDLDGDKPELVDYTGGSTQSQTGFNPDARVTISLARGNLKVRCGDGDGVRATLSYTLSGNDRDALQRMGDGIGLSVYGEGASGGAKVSVPGQPGSVKGVQIDLQVAIPKGAMVSATASNGWIDVLGCEGFVNASASDSAHAKGPMTGVKLSSSKGDAKLTLEGEKLSADSSVSAASGQAKLTFALDYAVTLDARGSTVQAGSHEIDGSVSDTSANGKIGGGGARLTVRAGNEVVVETD